MNFMKSHSKNLVGSRYTSFYNQITDKYLNFKNKPAKSKIIFRIDLKKFEDHSVNTKKEIKRFENKTVKILVQKFSSNYFVKKIENKYLFEVVTKTEKQIFNRIQQNFSNLNQLKFINIKNKNEKVFNFKTIHKTDFQNFVKNNQKYLEKILRRNIQREINKKIEYHYSKFTQPSELQKAVGNKIKISHLISNFKLNQSTPNKVNYNYNNFQQENPRTNRKFFERTVIKPYFISKFNNYLLENIKLNKKGTNKLFQNTNKVYLNSTAKFISTKSITDSFIKILDKNIKQKSEFINIVEKKVKSSQNFLYTKQKTEELEVRKENNFKKLKNEIDKIKTQILIDKSETIEEQGKEQKQTETVSKKDKHQLAEEIYEIVLRKWEKDLIKRGLLNG